MPLLDPNTGRPQVTPEGDPVTDRLDGKQRLSTIKYLIDKAMPTVRQVAIDEAHPTTVDAEAEGTVKALRNQTNAQLAKLIEAATTATTDQEAGEDAT